MLGSVEKEVLGQNSACLVDQDSKQAQDEGPDQRAELRVEQP